jgi:hypothetical protein
VFGAFWNEGLAAAKPRIMQSQCFEKGVGRCPTGGWLAFGSIMEGEMIFRIPNHSAILSLGFILSLQHLLMVSSVRSGLQVTPAPPSPGDALPHQ